ncbi:hypothetical protein JZ751_010059, partial [Albula glossodonta]
GLRYENRTQVAYGRDLVIPLSRKSAVLYFTPEASSTPILVWHARDPLPVDRGRGRGDGNHWILDGVTYEDQGKYTLYDNVNHILTTIILTVREERHSLDRRVNASMSIVLRVPLVDAQLSFTPEGSRVNHSLVRHGQIANESYRDRLRLLLSRIVLDDLTLEDSGTYDLRDSHFNLISTTRLYVSETGQSGSPYLGFLSLLGLIGGVFCCYKKKCCCFKRGKATDSNAHSVQHSPTQPEPKVGSSTTLVPMIPISLAGPDLVDPHPTGMDLLSQNGLDLLDLHPTGMDRRVRHLTGPDRRVRHLTGLDRQVQHLTGPDQLSRTSGPMWYALHVSSPQSQCCSPATVESGSPAHEHGKALSCSCARLLPEHGKALSCSCARLLPEHGKALSCSYARLLPQHGKALSCSYACLLPEHGKALSCSCARLLPEHGKALSCSYACLLPEHGKALSCSCARLLPEHGKALSCSYARLLPEHGKALSCSCARLLPEHGKALSCSCARLLPEHGKALSCSYTHLLLPCLSLACGYAPVMYSAPPTATEPVKVEEQKEATATDSLMANAEETGGDQKPATTPSNPTSSDFLHSTITGPEFKTDKGDATKASDPPGSTSETVNFL